MDILRISAASPTAFTDALAARDRCQDFDLVVTGKKSRQIWQAVEKYEAYKLALKTKRLARIIPFLLFATAGIRAPQFWGICILVEASAEKVHFCCGETWTEAQIRFARP